VNLDPLKTKQLHKGLAQLCEEGVAQFFVRREDRRQIVGTVGALQFEVIQYRLEHEYKAKCRFDALNYVKACWLESSDKDVLEAFVEARRGQIALDKDERYVYLAETQWSLDREIRENPGVGFCFTSEG